MASRVSVCWICGVKPQYGKFGRDCGIFTGMAQQNATVTGLPEHGLVLSGTIAEPVLENLTGQRILAWALRWVLARPNISAPLSYVCVFNSQLLSKTGADRAALAPGSSRAHRYEQGTRDIAQGEAPVSVSLDLAMLDDGSVVKHGQIQADRNRRLSLRDIAGPLLVSVCPATSRGQRCAVCPGL